MALGVVVNLTNLLVKYLDVALNAFTLRDVRACEPVALSHAHAYQLGAPRHHRQQQLLRRGGQPVEQALAFVAVVQRARKLRQRFGIDAVGLGEMAQRFGKGVRLARVNHYDGKAMGAQGSSRHLLQAPGGLQQHDGNAVRHGLELAQQHGHASLVVAKGLRFSVLTQGHLQRVFGDVNAYEKSFSR